MHKSPQQIDLLRKVYSKSEYPKIIDTSFNQLGQTTVEEDLNNEVTVEQFFDYYNDLFYEIPEQGETNSHAFLIKTSSEYINFDEINEEIAALREEITSLREELLATEKENANLLLSVANEQVPAGEEINSDLPAIDGTSTDGAQITGPGLSTNSNASSGGSTVVGGASSGGGGGY